MQANTDNVRVALADRSYDIAINSGSFLDIGPFLAERGDPSHLVLVTDTNVDPLHADRLADQLTEHGIEVHVMAVDAGEPSKSIDVAAELWEIMLEEGVDRQSAVLAVGGGVVGDLAGFVAATFARGLPFYQAPTTLLAQVDSSVGGKVGINLPGGKNMVGAFWQPQGVWIDVEVLNTLPDREFAAGLAEVVKYGVILDSQFFTYLEDNADAILARDPEVLKAIVARSCRLKADVVEADERESSGRRAILNYGHTFCHAIEAATGYEQILHGEGVAIGMICASRLATAVGMFNEADTERQLKLLTKFNLPTACPSELDAEELLQLMWRDKKVHKGMLRFILPNSIGEVELVDAPPSELVVNALKA